MSDRKAVIKNADMSEDMQQDAVDCATQAIEKYNIEKVATTINLETPNSRQRLCRTSNSVEDKSKFALASIRIRSSFLNSRLSNMLREYKKSDLRVLNLTERTNRWGRSNRRNKTRDY